MFNNFERVLLIHMISNESLDELTDFLDYELDVCGCLRLDKKFLARFSLENLTYKEISKLCGSLVSRGYCVCFNPLWERGCFVSKHQLSKWKGACSTCLQNDKGCVESCCDRRFIMRCKYCSHDSCPYNSSKYTVISKNVGPLI